MLTCKRAQEQQEAKEAEDKKFFTNNPTDTQPDHQEENQDK